MGFFDDIGGFFKKIGKGIKTGVGKAVKGIKNNVFTNKTLKGIKKGVNIAGKVLQAPAKYLKSIDPLKDKMGGASFLSPVGLIADIGLAIPSGAGYLSQLATDRKLQKKLAKGDLDTILDTGFSGLAVGGGLTNLAKSALKPASRKLSGKLAKSLRPT
tara:strand:- start:1279 stop:1752 length:474 start_codon:yes stop_codon:yes gene_type:complete